MEKLVFVPDEKMKDYYRLIAGIIYLIFFVPGIMVLPFYPAAGIIYLTPIIIVALFTFYWISLFYKSLKYTVTDEHDRRACYSQYRGLVEERNYGTYGDDNEH
jgi:TM2 domain-containing membrane protein YozV